MRSRTRTYLATACGLALVATAVVIERSAPVASAAPLRALSPAKAARASREQSAAPTAAIEPARDQGFALLRPLRFLCANAHKTENVRLYDDRGFVDENSAR